MSDENQPNPYEDLDAILREAEIACFIDDLGDRVVPFSGEYREWLFWVDVVDGWYSFRTTICKMPTASNLRVNLLTEAMRLNDDLIAAKFSAADWLYLNCAYRASDMDAEDLTKLLKFLVATAEAQYPNLFRVATGDSVLASLEASRKKMRLASYQICVTSWRLRLRGDTFASVIANECTSLTPAACQTFVVYDC